MKELLLHTVSTCNYWEEKYCWGCLLLGSEEDVISVEEQYISGVYTPEFLAELVDSEDKDECDDNSDEVTKSKKRPATSKCKWYSR